MGYKFTTNNRMELLAVIFALEHVKEGSVVEVTTDSKYVVNAVVKGWLNNWLGNGWRTASKKEVKNMDLWLRFIDAVYFPSGSSFAIIPVGELFLNNTLIIESIAFDISSTLFPLWNSRVLKRCQMRCFL